MKTDHIFYRIFQQYPKAFFELIGRPASEAQFYQFDSVEIKQTAFRIDGLFRPKSPQAQKPLYFGEVVFFRDLEIYSNLCAEIFTYLHQNQPKQDWIAVAVFASRSLEPTDVKHYQELLDSKRIIRVYLDELEEKPSSLGLAIAKLVVMPPEAAVERAKELLPVAKEELSEEESLQQNVLDLITTIVLYKFTDKSREELEAMLGLEDLRQSKFAQELLAEGRQEGKLESVPSLLALGLTVEQVAQGLGLTVKEVREIAKQQPKQE